MVAHRHKKIMKKKEKKRKEEKNRADIQFSPDLHPLV